jgi:ABC-type multidrug transport system ATPase subunit
MASIRTAGLTKDFGDLRAVNAINLDLPEGGVAGFVGPNGAGKSTTIRMLLGLITPTGKEVAFSSMEFNRMVDGKVEEHWVELDLFGLMQQLGAIPEPEHSEEASPT